VVRTVDGTRSADDVAREVARVAMEATSLVGVG
jgi:hypothetical protein